MRRKKEEARVIRKIKTLRDAKGLFYLKTRPRTETDVMYRHIPVRTIQNLKRGGMVKGIRDIQRISKKPWELELADYIRIRAQQERDKANRIYDALDRVNAAMAQVRVEQEKTQKFAEELQTANEEMQATNEELERARTDLEQFASVVSHDLQEPLREVLSYAQLLEKRFKPKLGKQGKEFIGYIASGTSRMQQLINDLLTFSRVGTKGVPFEKTDCRDALKGALTNLRQGIKENRAKVVYGSLPTVMADGTQLAQLFQNLIGNAIKFRSKKRPRACINAKLKGRQWQFSVRDNGIGIEPKHKERIFGVFQRLHSRKEYPGTGMGLAICNRIVERHGGRIWVASKLGKGATFYFTIPIMREAIKRGEILKSAAAKAAGAVTANSTTAKPAKQRKPR